MRASSGHSKRIPKYQQIGRAILEQLGSADRAGARLMKTQLELAEEFAVSRQTIRHALDWLERSGQMQPLAGREYGTMPVLPQPPSDEWPKVGFPIWANSLAELSPLRIDYRLSLANVLHAHLPSLGLQLDVQCVGSQRRPDLNKIARLCQEWQGLFLEPNTGESELRPDHPFASMRDRTVIIGTLQDVHFNSICPDFYRATQLAVNEFARLGMRKILYTGSAKETISNLFIRLLGAEKALERYRGMELIHTNDGQSFEKAFSEVKRFFIEGGRCDAVLANTSYAAIGAIRAMADLGIRVPDDVQLIAIGLGTLGAYTVPRPTSITEAPKAMGREAALMMSALLNPGAQPHPNILIPMQLVKGETTRDSATAEQTIWKQAAYSPLATETPLK